MMTASDVTVAVYSKLFRGRIDAYGTETGGCLHDESPSSAHYVKNVELHLEGVRQMGVYPMVYGDTHGWQCRWGCIDFDEGDEVSRIHAINTAAVMDHLGIWSAHERSRSKGRHLWVFADNWIPAKIMRRALLAACQIAGSPQRECNPKAETLDDPTKLGNYVRLPYPGGWETTNRQVMVDGDDATIDVDVFVKEALANRVSGEQLEDMAALWTPPVRPVTQFTATDLYAIDTDKIVLPTTQLMSKGSWNAWKHGPFEGADRSKTLWKLANKLATEGYSPVETLAFVTDADIRWGKFTARGDHTTLERLVAKVFG